MTANTPHYEDFLLKKLQPKGVAFLSIIVMNGPDITKFIAPKEFIDFYLKEALYNHDPTLIVPQATLGFYKWERFVDGQEILAFLKEHHEATSCESLVLSEGKKRLIVTIGKTREFSFSDWFFQEKPNFDYLLQ